MRSILVAFETQIAQLPTKKRQHTQNMIPSAKKASRGCIKITAMCKKKKKKKKKKEKKKEKKKKETRFAARCETRTHDPEIKTIMLYGLLE